MCDVKNITAIFGPAGNPDAFYEEGYKRSFEIPEWLVKQGLYAYEYSMGRGVRIKQETAQKIALEAKKSGISLSVHAPYFISLATEEHDTALNTRRHMLDSLQAAAWLGADRVIFHIGGMGKGERKDAFNRAKKLFKDIIAEAEVKGLNKNMWLVPETHGKVKQLGNLEEIAEFCNLADWVLPCVDFAHLHAVGQGIYTTEQEYEDVFSYLARNVSLSAAKNMHIHFSKIEYTGAGEKKHHTFADSALYGPPHEPLLKVIAKNRYTPRIICESNGTQAMDAVTMKNIYCNYLKESGSV